MFYIEDALGFVIVLAFTLFFAKLLGLTFQNFKLPQVLGYIIAGILLGPALSGEFLGFSIIGFASDVSAEKYASLFVLSDFGTHGLDIFAKLGVLLLMFSAGLETNLDEIRHTGLAATLIACAGVAVPLGLGVLISLPFGSIGLGPENIFRCIFIGTILTATSVAITVSVLKELGRISSKLGTTIVSAAIIDDVIGIVLLSVVTGIARSGGEQTYENAFEAFKATPIGTVVMIVAFFAVAILAGFGVSKLFRWMDAKWPFKHRIPVFSLVVCFVYSWVAEEIFGVADITGAFLAGIILSTDHRASHWTDKKINVNTYTMFGPVFFANIGISSISFAGVSPEIIVFALLAVLVGLLGKIFGCGAVCKAFGYTNRQSLIGGVGMMARGEVALIVTQTVTSASLGAAALPQSFVLMTVLLILFSSILTPILLKTFYAHEAPEPVTHVDELPA